MIRRAWAWVAAVVAGLLGVALWVLTAGRYQRKRHPSASPDTSRSDDVARTELDRAADAAVDELEAEAAEVHRAAGGPDPEGDVAAILAGRDRR